MDFGCSNCGAALRVDATLRTTKCPYCASPQLVQREPQAGRIEPAFTLGFALGEEPARERVRGWLQTRGFFREPRLKSAEIIDLKGIYVPAFLYTATAHAKYSVDIGENYQETETYTTTDSKGNTVVRTRIVTKTEWRSLFGTFSAYVADVLVTASRGIGNAELEAVEPYDLLQMRRFAPAMLSGWIAEEPTMQAHECMQLARGETMAHLGSRLERFMPGDSHRELQFDTQLENESADLVHVPMWVLAARHDPQKPPVRILVNGQSGKVVGVAPLSWLRIILVVSSVLAALGGLVAWARLS